MYEASSEDLWEGEWVGSLSHIREPCKLKGTCPSPLRRLAPGCTSSYHPRAAAVVAVAMTTGRGFIFNSGRRLEQCLHPAPRSSRVSGNASRPSFSLAPDVPLRLQKSSRLALISSWAPLQRQESKGERKAPIGGVPRNPRASTRRWWPDGRGIPSAMQPDLLPGFPYPPSHRVVELQRGVLWSSLPVRSPRAWQDRTRSTLGIRR